MAASVSEEKTTDKSGDTSPREAVAARHGDSPPADGLAEIRHEERREVPRVAFFRSPRDGGRYVAKKEDGDR